MSKNMTLVGAFVNKKRILSFLESVRNSLRIPIDNMYVYNIEGNKYEYLVTIKLRNRDDISEVNGGKVIHMKNGSVFSINALNKLIDMEKSDSNVSNENFELDWEKYKDKLIMLTNNELNIFGLERIIDKNVLLK